MSYSLIPVIVIRRFPQDIESWEGSSKLNATLRPEFFSCQRPVLVHLQDNFIDRLNAFLHLVASYTVWKTCNIVTLKLAFNKHLYYIYQFNSEHVTNNVCNFMIQLQAWVASEVLSVHPSRHAKQPGTLGKNICKLFLSSQNKWKGTQFCNNHQYIHTKCPNECNELMKRKMVWEKVKMNARNLFVPSAFLPRSFSCIGTAWSFSHGSCLRHGFRAAAKLFLKILFLVSEVCD